MPAPNPSAGPPLHGFRGDAAPAPPARPRGLTVALSRQAGARGGSIARRVGVLLGWQVFGQDALDHLARDDDARGGLFDGLPAGARAWADAQTLRLPARVAADADSASLARVVLAVAARGEAVIVGGAGFVLPPETTLHVRVVAPDEQRVAYLGDWLRLSPAEAKAELAARDVRRAAGLAGGADGPDGYDLVLNSARLGEAAAAALVVEAVRLRYRAGGSEPELDLFEPVG